MESVVLLGMMLTIYVHDFRSIYNMIYKESPRRAASGMSRCHFLDDFSCLS